MGIPKTKAKTKTKVKVKAIRTDPSAGTKGVNEAHNSNKGVNPSGQPSSNQR